MVKAHKHFQMGTCILVDGKLILSMVTAHYFSLVASITRENSVMIKFLVRAKRHIRMLSLKDNL